VDASLYQVKECKFSADSATKAAVAPCDAPCDRVP